MRQSVLGISAFYHDSAAALLVDGNIVAAAQEERFTRVKHDASFPTNAVRYVLQDAGVAVDDLAAVSFYDKPLLKFERLLETYVSYAPRGIDSYLLAMPAWIKDKLFIRNKLKRELSSFGNGDPVLLFPEHHLSHAASAFYPSPFEEAAILTVDGVGEWATTTIGYGKGKDITVLRELAFPHSLGLLYSAFTYYCGFKVNSGEYKLMGLAPYGNPDAEQTKKWKQLILDELIDVREDGSLLLNMRYFNFPTGLTMCHDGLWEGLFGIPPRKSEAEVTKPYMNMAAAIQQVTEDVVQRLAETAKRLTSCDRLVMAGGVSLNCVANGKLLRKATFKDIWIQPASGDAGGAVGAAYAAWHIWSGKERTVPRGGDAMRGSLLGPEFGASDIVRLARQHGAPFTAYTDYYALCHDIAGMLAQGKVVGWFQGRMEYGPRALGNRSILGDPRHPEMQKKLNLKIKFREAFRPFAPSVLEEECGTYFELDRPSPYMLLTAPVNESKRNPLPPGYEAMEMYQRLYYIRSEIPAVTHVDFSARVQTVSKAVNPRYWQLIKAFQDLSSCGLVVNTSFNVRGEPIVCTPEDAYRCFMRTEMDVLVMGDYVFKKDALSRPQTESVWDDVFTLD